MFIIRFFQRLFYLVFLVLGGIFFVPFKWLFFGTRGGRERRKIMRQQKAILKNQPKA
jgi:hypothetical protein